MAVTLPQNAGAAIPLAETDGFLLALEDGLYTCKDKKVELYKDLRQVYKPYWHSNDAKADPRGRIWFGASVKDNEHQAGEYFLRSKTECPTV
jgi:sugar lactone lactonase YvrE